MRPIANLRRAALGLLLLLPPLADAYDVDGLHTGLSFNQAMALATELGGQCSTKPPRPKVGGVSASCHYADCDGIDAAQRCSPEALAAVALRIGGQPVTTVELEAPGENQPLATISIFFTGEQ